VRCIRFLPVVFLVGIEGFAMFAPYVVLLFLAGYLITRLRSQQQPQLAEARMELPLEADLAEQSF
jgi:hypothetical protein